MNNQASSATVMTAADIENLTQSAEAGNIEAQHQLGMVYANGNGVELNYSKAFLWIEKAASHNHPQSMRTLAWLYANGFGTDQNDEKAQQCCYKLAELGDAKDQYFLASLYQTGVYGMTADSKKMIHWYYQSAQQHYARAQYALAKIILKGVDIEANDEMAFQWLSLANLNGHKKAEEELRKLIQRLPADMIEAYKKRMTDSIESSIQQS
ncbi:MAG: sel1 repeat family protein [Gammaproteobacteria bacterium]|nr:sel1 repeat family protein [Gammaproteobacteria bacterium]